MYPINIQHVKAKVVPNKVKQKRNILFKTIALGETELKSAEQKSKR